MTEFIGQSGHHLLFSDEAKETGVVIDSRVSLVVTSGEFTTLLEAMEWGDGTFSSEDVHVAGLVLSSGENESPEPTGRMYTIPRGAQVNARKGLNHADSSPASRYIGALLAAGGQVSFNELALIAGYFDGREEEDTTTWRLYGGAPAKKWASTIFEREPITASYEPLAFSLKDALEENPEAGPEFLIRINTETGILDRLYRIDLDKRAYVWDEASWTDLGQTEWNIWDYDIALDGKAASVYETHILIDVESALRAATLLNQGISTFTVEDINPEETSLALSAIEDEDWYSVDQVLTAALAPGDGIDSPEERSARASTQVRDGNGKFAKTGSKVIVNGDPQAAGTITLVNPANGTVEVEMDNGGTQVVRGDQVEGINPAALQNPGAPIAAPRVDFSGILAEPRTPNNRKLGQVPGTLPKFGAEDIHKLINNFPSWVSEQRASFKPLGGPSAKVDPDVIDHKKISTARSTYQHPFLDSFTKRKRSARTNFDPVVAAAEVGTEITPETSDVQPVYMAIVSPDDPRAVFKLVSLVPASSTSNQPAIYSREDGEWIRDDETLMDLKSATPPPVVPLDDEALDDTLTQVDEAQGVSEKNFAPETVPMPALDTPDADTVTASGIDDRLALMVMWGPRKDIMEQALTAAGGADRNRGGAEKLRKYWTTGPGAAKIRWNTPGDWTRCVRHLGKYLGARAEGYCALRHKEMTHMWTGDKKHRQMYASNLNDHVFSTDLIKSTDELERENILIARQKVAQERVITASASAHPKYQVYDTETHLGLVAAALAIPSLDAVGGAFFIPLALPESIESGDGRKVTKYATEIRDLPLPLMWQIQTAEGHSGSVVVGRIERMGRTPYGIGAAYGHFDTGVYGREAERMVRAGMLRHVSSDMDKFEAEAEEASDKSPRAIGKDKLAITKARVMGVTIVAKPAFQECTIEMAPIRTLTLEDEVLPDGIYVENPDPADAVALVAAGYIADAIPVIPPKSWFDDPQLTRATPLSVDDSGHVFGHVAAWETGHLAPSLNGINPPHSETGYSFFHTGVVRVDDGTDITVGQLTLTGGHAELTASAREAVKHYDDTGSAMADVHAGEDEFGIWVAGALRPGVTPEQIRVFRASAPSGDWRPIKGKLELVAVCQVNVPGFPIARAMVASGEMTALVAAGASMLAHMRPDPVRELASRVEALEKDHGAMSNEEMSARVADALGRVNSHRERVEGELSSRADALVNRMESFGYVSKKAREQAADKGEALPDGSFAIRNETDLAFSIQAYGRTKDSDKSKVRKHIMKRARALGHNDYIPEVWKTAASEAITASVMSLRERVDAARAEQALVASVESDIKKLSPAERQKLANDLRAKGQEVPESLDPKAPGVDEQGRPKYKPGHQPRDYNGQFRDVLARLKGTLGTDGTQDVVDDIEATDHTVRAGDYVESVKAGLNLKSQLDRLDSGALNKEAISSIRTTSRELGKTIANLPLPFKNQAAKVRFSDLPPNLRELMKDMAERVVEKIGESEGNKATAKIRSFMSGGDLFSQGDVSQEMSRMLRLLT